jgi:oligopeptide transport system substrate-binding protein
MEVFMNVKQMIFLILLIVIVIFGIALIIQQSNLSKSESLLSEPVAEKVLNWNIGSEPLTLDPQLNRALDGGSVINNTFEGLFRYKGNKIVPAIAESYQVSSDGLTYTFKLKKTNWSDGSPLTASDFEYAWKRALDSNTGSEYAYQLYYIKGGRDYHTGTGKRESVGVKAIDDDNLEVVLEVPTPYFLDLLTFFTYMPIKQSVVEASQDGNWAIDPKAAISNGPFILSEYRKGNKLVLVKNKHYWQADAVLLDRINAYMIVDESTMLTAYNSGELDIIDSILASELPRIHAETDSLITNPTIGTYFYAFNTRVKPLDNVLVRKALSLSIDRKAIVESVTKAGEIPASGFTPPGLYDANGDVFQKVAGDYDTKPSAADLDTARKLLAEAGFEDMTQFPKLDIVYNTNETHKIIAEAIQYMWQNNLGIEVTLTNQEWAVLQETKQLGNYTIAKAGWFGDYADPMSMLEIMTSSNAINTTGWSNADYDALIEAAKRETGQQRFESLYKAQAILMQELPIMPIYYHTDQFLVSDRIANYEKSAMGLWYFGNTDIDTAIDSNK